MTQPHKVDIRKYESSDQSRCAEIYSDAWNGAMPHACRSISMDEFESETEEDDIFVALLNGQIVGYIALYEPEFFVHHLFIDPKVQGGGIGTALLDHAARLAGVTPLSLKCQLDNRKALAFYEAFGFFETDERGTNDYGDWIRLMQG